MPKEVENPMVVDELWNDEPEYWGTDWRGNEINVGDNIVFDPANDEVILEEDLEDYLIERLGFVYTVAEQKK